MNRKQRRNIAKMSPTEQAKALMGQEQQIRQEVRDSTLVYAIETIYPLFAYELHKVCGFGEKRIRRVLDAAEKDFSCIASGHLAADDIKQWLQDTYDIRVTAGR